MNIEQRELIADLYDDILQCSVSGDVASISNSTSEFVNKIKKTDKRLEKLLEQITICFEE